MAKTKKTKILIVIIVLLIAAIGTYLYKGYIFSPKDQQAGTPPDTTNTQSESHASTTLFIDTENSSVSAGLLKIPIAIDTGENSVSAVELHLTYDPKLLAGVSILPGGFFSNPIIMNKIIDQAKGTIIMTVGSLAPNQGAGTLASISASPAKGALITIGIDPKTKVAAIGENGSVLTNARDGSVQAP